ncbi:MAG: helix-turn-helix domain-containing protein [Holophaga sp.]|nr:helix-turn-helix domain-containing protein [Holophaga sp.]
MECLPGSTQWRASLGALLRHPEPVWVFGETGTGVSTVAAWMATQRSAGLLDDAERLDPAALEAWIAAHPQGVLGSHLGPAAVMPAAASRCLPFRLRALQDDPASVPLCLAALAAEEGLAGAPPPALGALPCSGNLRELRNRLVRWKLLGQLPDDLDSAALPLETEDLAANLHVLERLLLHRALRRSYGNRVEAAHRLGVSRRQLYLLIARHGDPVRGELPSNAGPKRLNKPRSQNSSFPPQPADKAVELTDWK